MNSSERFMNSRVVFSREWWCMDSGIHPLLTTDLYEDVAVDTTHLKLEMWKYLFMGGSVI